MFQVSWSGCSRVLRQHGVWVLVIVAVCLIVSSTVAAARSAPVRPQVEVRGNRTLIRAADHQVVVDKTGESEYMATFTRGRHVESVVVGTTPKTVEGRQVYEVVVANARNGKVLMTTVSDTDLFQVRGEIGALDGAAPDAAIVYLITDNPRATLGTLAVQCLNLLRQSGIAGTILGLWYSGASVWYIGSFVVALLPEILTLFGWAVLL